MCRVLLSAKDRGSLLGLFPILLSYIIISSHHQNVFYASLSAQHPHEKKKLKNHLQQSTASSNKKLSTKPSSLLREDLKDGLIRGKNNCQIANPNICIGDERRWWRRIKNEILNITQSKSPKKGH